MFRNKIIIVTIIFVSLMAISAVSANEDSTNYVVGLNDSNENMLLDSENSSVNEDINDPNAFIDAPSVLYYTDDYDDYPYDDEVTYGYENDFEGYLNVYNKNNNLIFSQLENGSNIEKSYSLFKLFTKNNNKLTLGKYSLEMKDINGKVWASEVVTVEKSITQIKFPTVKATNDWSSITHYRYVQDEFDKVIRDATGTVKITVCGKTYSAKVNKGYYTITFKIPSKCNTYACKITYSGNFKYKSSSSSFKLIVTKPIPKLSASSKSFKVKSTKKYTITLKNNADKVMKNTKVSFKVKGKTFYAKTNSNGKATFKITNLNKKGTYSGVVKYAGNSKYSSVSKNVKIRVI